jgi:glycosyltransferase involved in cell wall biosynthesis
MEAVTHETSGLIVDVSDSTELAGAVKRLADNPALRQQFGENGRRWVEQNFLIARNSEILARAFHDVSQQ